MKPIKDEQEFILKSPENISDVLPYLNNLFRSYELNRSLTLAQIAIAEFSLNAFKAIHKRIFFKEKSLDINKPEDYLEGIQLFRNAIKFEEININDILKNHPEYFVKIKIAQFIDEIVISITNNTPMLKAEIATVTTNLELAQKETIIQNPAYDDNGEGAGIGLKTVLMIAKNIGFSSDIVSFQTNEVETTFNIRIILYSTSFFSKTSQLSGKVQKISSIINNNFISFPILEQSLIQLIDSEYTSNLLLKDPGILMNFLIAKKRHLNEMFTLNSTEDFFRHYKQFTAINEKSALGLIYSEAIEISALILLLDKLLNFRNANIARAASLLCKFGKMVFLSIDEETYEKIHLLNSAKSENDLPINNEDEIGLYLAKLWNFPPEIISAIEFYDKPWLNQAKDNIAEIVHLALGLNQLRKNNDPSNFDDNVLQKLGIKENNLKNFYNRFIEYIDKSRKETKDSLKGND